MTVADSARPACKTASVEVVGDPKIFMEHEKGNTLMKINVHGEVAFGIASVYLNLEELDDFITKLQSFKEVMNG